MSNNVYKFTSPTDTNATTYNVDQVVSYRNVGDSTTTLVNTNIATYYGNFPTKSNIAIDNNNFDSAVGTIGYKINGTDLGNSFPAAVDYYNATTVRNSIALNWGSTTTIPSDNTFNATTTNNVTIENCFNHISVILCGGGGGGGFSNSSGNGGWGGSGGGGGGWGTVHRIPLTNTGRQFNVICGGGGYGGIWGGSLMGYAANSTNSGDGGSSQITSNTNPALTAIANGGQGGGSAGNNISGINRGPGSSSSNFNNAAVTLISPLSFISIPNNFGATNGGADNNPGTYGGDPLYNAKPTGSKNSGLFTNISHSGNAYIAGNNQPGIPAQSTNYTYNTGFNATPITYNLNLTSVKGGGGGGAAANNGGNANNHPGSPGGPGAPGYVIIYKYLS